MKTPNQRWPARVVLFSGWIILLLWLFAPQYMRITHPNFTGCNPLTALCFIGLGTFLLAGSGTMSTITVPAVAAVTAISLVRLCSGWFGYRFLADKLIFPERLQGVQFSMATAICFLLIGSALLWLRYRVETATRWGPFLLVPVAGLLLFSLLGFILNERDVRDHFFLSPMSMVTTVLLLVMMIPLITLFRKNTWLMTFQSNLLGGLVARRLLPWFLVVPVLLFAVGATAREAGVFNYALSGSVQISILFFALFLVLLKLAKLIDTLDLQQRTSLNQLAVNADILDKTNKDLQTFSYAASHDLQEPLRKISIYARIVSEQPDHPRRQEYLEKIVTSAGRGTQLILDILEYSRTTQHQEFFEKTDLGTIIQEVITDFDRLEDVLPPKIEISAMPVIEATPFQMRQLFSNLLSNSLKFVNRDRQPEIYITATRLTSENTNFPGAGAGIGYWQIVFSDNGEGFDAKHSQEIFTVFKRVGRSKVSGSGIGLSLCRKIVENHGGQISAWSSPGNGAQFTIILPEKQPTTAIPDIDSQPMPASAYPS